MKKLVIIFSILASLLSLGQTIDDENSKIEFTQVAEFPGGNDAFIKEFMKMVHAYIDLKMYVVNGKFTFLFDIDEKGKISNLEIFPKIKDSEMFVDDMQFAMRKVKTKWKPAMNNGTAVKSRYILKINFTSDHFDFGD